MRPASSLEFSELGEVVIVYVVETYERIGVAMNLAVVIIELTVLYLVDLAYCEGCHSIDTDYLTAIILLGQYGRFLLASKTSILGGGSSDAEACREFLAGYGLVAADQDLDAELHDDLFCAVINGVVGQEMFTTDTPDAPVSRADVADIFFQFSGQ